MSLYQYSQWTSKIQCAHLSHYLLSPQGTQSSRNSTQASTCLWLCESLVGMVPGRRTLGPDKVKHREKHSARNSESACQWHGNMRKLIKMKWNNVLCGLETTSTPYNQRQVTLILQDKDAEILSSLEYPCYTWKASICFTSLLFPPQTILVFSFSFSFFPSGNEVSYCPIFTISTDPSSFICQFTRSYWATESPFSSKKTFAPYLVVKFTYFMCSNTYGERCNTFNSPDNQRKTVLNS